MITSLLLKAIRWFLGKLILWLNSAFSPRPLERSPEEQSQVDRATAALALYQFEACPFCVKVRREIRRLNLKIELRDAKSDAKFAEELLKQGGALQVPCLKISENSSVRWMYESSDIVDYLRQKFSPKLGRLG